MIENLAANQKEIITILYDPEGNSNLYAAPSEWGLGTSDYIVLTILVIVVGTLLNSLRKSGSPVEPYRPPGVGGFYQGRPSREETFFSDVNTPRQRVSGI